jgi:hypothetical protein
MSGSMSGVRSKGVLRVRLPWLDPTLATPHDFALRSNEFIDLNRLFRDHLTSPLFLRDVIRDAHTAIAALDRRRRIRGETAWALQRSVRLAAAAAALNRTRNAVGPSAECLDEYFHALATGTRWHFTSRSACPVPDGDPRTLAADDSLGWIGKVFERWVLGSELPKRAAAARRVIVVVHDDGQLPFAHLLLRPRTQNSFASRVEIEYGGSVDPRLVSLFAARLPLGARATDPTDADGEISPLLTPAGLLRAARFFRRSPRRCLFVRWHPGPKQRLGARVRRQVATLRAHRIPVALELLVQMDALRQEREAFLFTALDELLGLQRSLARVTVRARTKPASPSPPASMLDVWRRDLEVSDLLQAQLMAELENLRLVPHRTPRRMLTARTSLVCARPYIVRSRFDLDTISQILQPARESRPHRLGFGTPPARTPVFHRKRRVAGYRVFIGFPRVVEICPQDEAYSDALAMFARPRRARAFIDCYRPEQRVRALAFLDHLVENRVLRFV